MTALDAHTLFAVPGDEPGGNTNRQCQGSEVGGSCVFPVVNQSAQNRFGLPHHSLPKNANIRAVNLTIGLNTKYIITAHSPPFRCELSYLSCGWRRL